VGFSVCSSEVCRPAFVLRKKRYRTRSHRRLFEERTRSGRRSAAGVVNGKVAERGGLGRPRIVPAGDFRDGNGLASDGGQRGYMERLTNMTNRVLPTGRRAQQATTSGEMK